MNNTLEILDWDCDFFGCPVARISASDLSAEKLKALIEEAVSRKLKLLYLFCDPADLLSCKTAENSTAQLVDQKITFHRYVNGKAALETDSKVLLYQQEKPNEQILSLTMQSGQYSRYKVDENFKNNEFEKMYRIWIENSLNKKIADYTFVYMEEGKELGFVTLRVKSNKGVIGLIAVDTDSRGKSIGKKLVSAVVNQLYHDKIPELDVATQVNNIEACNFYLKVGFTGAKTENIYHIWL